MAPDLPAVDSIEDSLEAFLSRHSRRGSVIYLAVILLILIALTLLPVIRVGVSLQADGIIRPMTEKHEVVASVPGFVERVTMRENGRVESGSEILVLVAGHVDSQRAILDGRLREVESMVQDLEILTSGDRATHDAGALRTGRFQSEHRLFLDELLEVDLRKEHALRELARSRQLAMLDAAPRSEREDREFELDRLDAERSSLVQRYLRGWQVGADQLRSEHLQLLERRLLLADDSARFVVRSPIEGTIEQMANISPGSFVQAGQSLAIVSPASELIAEVFVSPSDFGLLEIGTPVRLLVDAFNYRDWGFIPGKVLEIPDDYVVVDGRPFFRTVVKLETTELTLRGGFSRQVKKGMTLRARFMVTERSLWQLLRDDINDWLNPLQRPA